MAGKAVAAVASIILVVGVVIGVVAVVHNKQDNGDGHISSSMKSVNAICEPTSFKDVCVKSLESVANNDSATPKDYLMAAIYSTLAEVNKSMDATGKIDINVESDPYHHMAVEDCKELLDDAISTLQASYSSVGDSSMHTLQDRAHEFRSWMTAVYSLQASCMDQFEKPEYKSAIENGMINATQLTHNAIDIIAELSDLLKQFDIPINLKAAQRDKEREDNGDIDSDGYPSWMPAADRKLLGQQKGGGFKPNAVVAKDGSGQFKTVKEAIDSYPKKFQGRFSIYVKAGVYDEFIVMDKAKRNVYIYGDGPGKSIITGKRNVALMKNVGTMQSATFASAASGLIARGLTFRNEAGPEGHQAVALRLQGDMSTVYDCNIEGYQDTLYYHASRQFYRNCVISGTIDFIFGMGDAFIQNSLIIVRKPLDNQKNTVTADGRIPEKGTNGLVIQNCRIVPEKALWESRFKIPTYLGRPWRPEARTVIMQTEIGDFIRPEGWMIWDGETYHETCEMYEYGNRGPGANTAGRNKQFKKFKVLDRAEAQRFTAPTFLGDWVKNTGAPLQLGL